MKTTKTLAARLNRVTARSTETMLVHKDLVKAIEGTLIRRGTARQDLEDGVADVQVKTLEYLQTHDAPADLGEWKKLCNKIAKDLAVDAYRKKKRRAKYDVDLCEEPDAYAGDRYVERTWDPVDEGRLMAIVEEQLRAANIPEVAFMILDAEAAGTMHTEIAEELGVPENVVATRLWTMRRGFRRRVEQAGLSNLAPHPVQARDIRARTGARKR